MEIGSKAFNQSITIEPLRCNSYYMRKISNIIDKKLVNIPIYYLSRKQLDDSRISVIGIIK